MSDADDLPVEGNNRTLEESEDEGEHTLRTTKRAQKRVRSDLKVVLKRREAMSNLPMV